MSENKYLTGSSLVIAFIGICLGTFLFVLDYSIANVAIPYIAGDLAVSNDQGTYVITSFAVGNAILLPMTGWLVKRVGAVRLFILSLFFFTLFSFLCGIANSILMLVALRFIQGLAAGPLVPLGQTFTMRVFPPHQRNLAIAIFAVIVLVAPVLGPIVGGYICINYHWGWIFFINIPTGIIALIAVSSKLGILETPTEKLPLDYIGFFLLAVGVTSLQIMLDKGQQWNWFTDSKIQILSIVSFLALLYMTIRCLTSENPFIDLRLFKRRTFTVACIILSIGYSLYFGIVVLVPLWLQTYMGYNALWAGLAVAPIGYLPIIFGVFVARLMKLLGRVTLLVIAFSFFAISSYFVTFFTPQVDFFHISLSRFLLGGGVLFFITPLFNLSTSDLADHELAMGTGVFHFLRALSGGIGTSIYTTIWYRRMSHQHVNFSSFINDYNPLTLEYFSKIESIGLQGRSALELANTLVDQQVSVLAICETFAFMTIVSILLILLSFFAYTPAPQIDAVKVMR